MYSLCTQVDIRQNPGYINWKTGVELRLYAFQLAQAQPTVSIPLAMTVLPKPVVPVAKPWVQDWAANDLFSPMTELDDDHLDLASWSVPPTPYRHAVGQQR
jgi:hypothetical protein